MLNIIIIGCGAVTEELHAAALKKIERSGKVSVAALVDPDESRTRRMQRWFPRALGHRTVDEAYPRTAAPRVTLVASPPGLHRRHVGQALEAGSHVLCEKPFTPNGRDSTELKRLGKAAGVKLAVGMPRRFFPSLATARRLIHAGTLGWPLTFACREGSVYAWPITSDAPFRREVGGGGVEGNCQLRLANARAKIATEARLRGFFNDTAVACVVLRPGLIWGPRSPWVEGPATELSQGTAYLIGGGEGVCNLLHVDNLIENILAVVRHPVGVSGCFNVADDELIRWRQYLAALAKEIGVEPSAIHRLPAGPFRASLGSRLADLKQTAAASWLKKRLSRQSKQKIKILLGRFRTPLPDHGSVPPLLPEVTRGIWHLQGTRHKLPTAKFAATFGRPNRLSFQQGMAGTGEWLRFAGFGRLNP